MRKRALIETQELSKRFGDLLAVDRVSLRVQPGEILALLGPNGAGKTTTIRMLATILRPSSGRAKVAGYDVVERPLDVRRSIGLLSEHHGLYSRMVAREYIAFFGSAHGLSPQEVQRRTDELLERFGLLEHSGRRLGEYSKGMRQKLALVRCLLHDPRVILLDEPTSALDPASARLVRENIADLRSSDRAIVVCTHNLGEAEELADRIAIIRQGSIIAHGSVPELRKALLGDPVIELRLARPLDGASRHLPPDLSVVEEKKDRIRYQTSRPEVVNPQVLEAMAMAKVPVMSLAEVRRSLEEIYLRVVTEDVPVPGARHD
ncbi:MAG: ABC transporter ATP-binding protein [Anaerolineales bacterium]|jgi:ABC-2 type transport system ATP-binding protein